MDASRERKIKIKIRGKENTHMVNSNSVKRERTRFQSTHGEIRVMP